MQAPIAIPAVAKEATVATGTADKASAASVATLQVTVTHARKTTLSLTEHVVHEKNCACQCRVNGCPTKQTPPSESAFLAATTMTVLRQRLRLRLRRRTLSTVNSRFDIMTA